MICMKHNARPAKIYDQCVGCEIESLRSENAKLLADEAIAFNESTQLRYLVKRQQEQLEKYMQRLKMCLDAFDKIIDEEGNPIEIAVRTSQEVISLGQKKTTDSTAIKQVKRRYGAYIDLIKKMNKANEAEQKNIIRGQKSIESYYYGDVRELLETLDNAVYQLESLEPLLNIPDKGYVRNNFRRVVQTLKGEY